MRRHMQSRRGVALFIVLLFVVAVGVMALTAIVTTGNAALVAKSYARENDLRYAAEAALAIGKSRINANPSWLPDTGYRVMMQDAQLTSADNQIIPGVKVTVYVGPSGSTSGQFGRYASIVAEARDNQGNGFLRRLELSQESFAKYAYWSNDENPGGTTIYFGNNDELWGPVWSNDVISIAASKARFHDDVATAKTISGVANGTFFKGYKQNQKPITLPSMGSLSAKMDAFATAAGFKFNAPTSGAASTARLRIEFIALDLDSDGDSTDADEGFFRVYQANASQDDWLRSDWPGASSPAALRNCGDWHGGKFFPAAVHPTAWFAAFLGTPAGGSMTPTQASNESNASVYTIMSHTGARCYLGGDPHLSTVERTAGLGYTTTQIQSGGDDATFTPTDPYGAWIRYTATPDARVLTARPNDAQYLFPLHRTLNPETKGVIYVAGTVGVSGNLRGKVSLFATNTITVLDDLRYVNDPANGACTDMLGLIAGMDVVVADNALISPQQIRTSPITWKALDDTKDLYLHTVVMALNTSFTVENYSTGPSDVNDCEGTNNGRGCLYLSGGLIQASRGPVGLLSGEGFVKRYSYDRCAIVNPPPYFPTTGRFLDNRYYELNPVGFNARSYYESITPDP